MNKNHRHHEQFTIDVGSFLPQHLRCILVQKSKRRRKTIALIIKPNNTIMTLAPFHINRQRIIDFINSKKEWIKKRTAEIQMEPPGLKPWVPTGGIPSGQAPSLPYRQEGAPSKGAVLWPQGINSNGSQPKNFAEGELFPYIGRHYRLKITHEAHKDIFLTDDSFVLSKGNENNAKKIFIHWYKKQTEIIIKEKTAFYSKLMSLSPKKIKISSARQRWGSCSHTNTLNFSWRIISLPSEIIDYIVVHELAHINQKNHSGEFWKIVSATVPDYKARKKWLRDQSRHFDTSFA